MERRTFMKIAIGALMFPQLPTSATNTDFSVKGWSSYCIGGEFDEVVVFKRALERKEIELLMKTG